MLCTPHHTWNLSDASLAGRLSDLGQKFAFIILHIHVQIMDRKCSVVRYNKVCLVWTCVHTCDAAFGSIRLVCCALFLVCACVCVCV